MLRLRGDARPALANSMVFLWVSLARCADCKRQWPNSAAAQNQRKAVVSIARNVVAIARNCAERKRQRVEVEAPEVVRPAV
jgi:hypothetical protein